MKTVFTLLMLAVSLAGCSTTPGIKANIVGANIEIAKQRAVAAAKPILDARIPTPHGDMIIIVHAPQGANNGQIAMPDDPAWRVAGQAVGMIGTGINFLVGGKAAVGLVRATSSGIIGALREQPDPVIVQPATPIVVEQPAPIIVEQPAPVIVTQPEPIIVPPAEPVIVNPVIVPAP